MRGVFVFTLCLICSALFSQSASINLDDAMEFTSDKVTLNKNINNDNTSDYSVKRSAVVTKPKTNPVKPKKAIDIYPAPSYDKLVLKTDGFNFNHIFVSTMNGRLKLEQRIDFASSANIDVSHLQKGTYLLTIRSGSREKEQYFTVK